VHLEHGPKNGVRAVKVIDKATLSPAFDFTKELAIMSFLTKVCLSVCCSVGWSVSGSNGGIASCVIIRGVLRLVREQRKVVYRYGIL